MSLDPTIVQQLPTGADDATDVGYAVIDYLTQNGLGLVAADHESRIAFGEKKYGQRLKIDNGRDVVMDSYQELLDFLSYAMQAQLEGKPGFSSLFQRVAIIAEEVRCMLQGQPHTPEDERCNKVTFVPNQAGPTREEFLKQRFGDEIVAVPFSELEGTVLNEIDTNVMLPDGTPLTMDVAGNYQNIIVEQEPVTELGEKLVAELDSFDESPSSSEIAEPITAYAVGCDSAIPPLTVIDSEEKMTQLENKAMGASR